MGFLVAMVLTAIVVAMGAVVSTLTGLFMGLGTAIVTSVIGFIAFLMVLI